MRDERPAFARREVVAVGAVVGAVLLAFSGRYGYHRDELYFLEAGKHLAWGYPDQPPVVPLLARLSDLIAPGSLVVLRLPATLGIVIVVVLTGLMARELGAGRGGQTLAAAAIGMSGIVLTGGHLLSTATIGFLGWVALSYVLVRALAGTASLRVWLAGGVVAGLTMQANPLMAAFLVVFSLSLLAVGPREWLRTPGPYVAAAVAAVIIAPYVIWQATHRFPQIDVARGIADGGSGTSAPRIAFIPFQLLLIGPWLTPIWVTGLVRLLRRRPERVFAWTYLGLCVLFLVVGGKPYYVVGLYPVLIAAGAQPFLDRVRWRVTGVLLVLSLPVVVIGLPILPVRHEGAVVAVNYDAGETIGWPHFVDEVATAYRRLPIGSAILTGNYGEAGAIDRYGPDHGLPQAYSGHMAFAEWGPPPSHVGSVLAIGVEPSLLREIFGSVAQVGTLRNPWGIDNDEQDMPMYACRHMRRSWAGAWPLLQHY